MTSKYDRQIRLFGEVGQERLRCARVAVCGLGGLGSHVVQQLAFLGVGSLVLVDDDVLENTNRNRLIGVRATDPDGVYKAEIAKRLVTETNPDIAVKVLTVRVEGQSVRRTLETMDWVFGCFDNDAARLEMLGLTAERGLPYVDLATDVLHDDGELVYGGHVIVAAPGRDGCAMCLEDIDQEEVREMTESGEERQDRQTIYGVATSVLSEVGPSVVCLNGVIASLGVMEFMVAVTDLRPPVLKLEYRGMSGTVLRENEPPLPGCFFCAERTRNAQTS